MVIYKVTNKNNGKSYVGQTVRDLKVRKTEHLHSSSNISRTKYPAPLHLAMSKEGSSSFEWKILETCLSQDHLNEREKFYIQLLNTLTPNGYNQTTGGAMDGSMSEEIRDKIAESMVKVHQDPTYQAKVYPKLKGLVPPNKGVPMTETQKVKVSAARKAVYDDPTYINPNVGQKRTGQALENLHKAYETRELPKGKEWIKAHKDQYTPEVRAKMRAHKVGKKPTNTKEVMCIETGVIYKGLTDASKALNVNRQSIWLQIKGKLKSVGGLHFKYSDKI